MVYLIEQLFEQLPYAFVAICTAALIAACWLLYSIRSKSENSHEYYSLRDRLRDTSKQLKRFQYGSHS